MAGKQDAGGSAGAKRRPGAGSKAGSSRSTGTTRKSATARKTKSGSSAKTTGKRAGTKKPVMFPRILCPLDFSEPSISALKEAVKLARTFSSRLYLLHVVSSTYLAESIPTSPEFDLVPYQKELLRIGKQKMKEAVEKEVPSTIETRQLVVNGAIDDEILKLAEKEKISLIVIATHGRTGWRHLVFGSVTEKIIRQAGCPVLTVHPEKD